MSQYNVRSWVFTQYLSRQSPARRTALLLAEKEYVGAYGERLLIEAALFNELMQGTCERPAGRTGKTRDVSTTFFANDDDPLWRPARDKALGDRMITYAPPRHPLQGIRF